MDHVGFSVYQVGSLDAKGNWELTESLSGKGVELNDLSYASQWDAAASRLAYLVRTENLQGMAGVTDDSGRMNMEGLAEGMYLVVQHEGKTYGDISPFLVSIPCQDGEIWTDDVTVYPKSCYTPDDEKGRITVTKRAGYLDTELMEVVTLLPIDFTYYVGIFLDSQGTVPYGDDYIRSIRMQSISKGTAVFENLPKGTYYIFETDKYGNPISVGNLCEDDGISWVCELENKSAQKVELESEGQNKDNSVGLFNLYDKLPSEFSYCGFIDITKEVRSGDTQITVDDTFYAGIFLDRDATELYRIVELKQNDTVEAEVSLGGEKGDGPITYYIYETDEQGNRIDQDSFPYLVSGESRAELSKEDSDADITIVNTIREDEPKVKSSDEPQTGEQPEEDARTDGITDVPETDENMHTTDYQATGQMEVETDSSNEGEKTAAGTDTPRTGDYTDAGSFLLMAALAVIVGGTTAGLRRKKGRL
jgi:hypothetical protein